MAERGRPRAFAALDAAIEAEMDRVALCDDLVSLQDVQVSAARLILAVSDRQRRLIAEHREEARQLSSTLEALKRDGLDARRTKIRVVTSRDTDLEIDVKGERAS